MNRTRLPAFQRPLHRWVLGLALLCAGLSASAQQGPQGEVARLNVQEGAVSVSPAGQDRWYAARPDRALGIGDRLRTERNARAEVYIGQAALRLDGATDVEFSGPDEISVGRGDVQLRVGDDPSGQSLRIDTGNLSADIGAPGEYRLSTDSATTWVAVASGQLTLRGQNGASQRLTDRQQTTVSGRNLAAARNTRAQNSSFDAWVAERNRFDSAGGWPGPSRFVQPAAPSAATIAREQQIEYERAQQAQQAQWLEQQRGAQAAQQLQEWQRDQEWRQQQEWQQQQDWRRQQDWRQRAEQDRWQQQRQQQQVQQQLQQQQQQALRQQQELQLRAAQAQAQQQQQLLQQQQRAAQQAAQVQQQQQQLRQQQELQLRAAQMQQQALAQQQAQQNAMRQAQEAQLRAIQQQQQQHGTAPAAPRGDDPRRLWTSPDSR